MPKKTERGNFFGSVPWATGVQFKICRTSVRTILVTSGVSEKKTKCHDYSRLFS